MATFFTWQEKDLCLYLHVQPKTSRNEIVGPYHDRLKVKITAPPVEGAANLQLIQLLAKVFGVAPSQVHVTHGIQGKYKTVIIRAPKKIPSWLETGQ